jgi:dTDP-4-amino-4,6-dideoxygalactose transaminase
MDKQCIQLSFHYQALHQSTYFLERNQAISLSNAERFSDCLVRFPFHIELTKEEVQLICNEVREFFT